ncbi:MAG TPA: efflux transporter outer membrane subunit [Steroidobacteraceae bacterium]|nr:efflux transporter outer membrane subunit [Steroidobacteraceae bacterium]
MMGKGLVQALHGGLRLEVCILGGGVLAACSLGPAYRQPVNPAPTVWVTPVARAGPGESASAKPVANWPRAAWWRGFGSAQLDTYIADAQANNNDISVAIAQVREADAEARIAGAPLLPSLALQASANRQKSFSPFSGSSGTLHDEYTPTLTASYELDFWGENRATRAAALAAARASRYARDTVALTVVSSVALTYFETLELHDRLQVARNNLSNAQHVLDGLQFEARVGTATALDVAQQAATVGVLNAAIPPLRQQLRVASDALAILIGRAPESVTVAGGSLADIAEPVVYPGLPSALLVRRPDVAQAEEQLRAANANIAVARAAIFPSVTLTADGGFASGVVATVLSPASRVYGLTAALAQDVFEGGKLLGAYEYNKARYGELLADYRKTVLTAFSNVEDALVSLRQTAEQQRREQVAVDTARRAFAFAQLQMRAGVANVLTVLNTETALFTAQDTLVQIKYAHLQALVDLYQALGGGWSRSAPGAFPAPGKRS